MSLYDELVKAENPVNAYRRNILKNVRAKKILHSAFFELTPLCNFTCPFCYARVSPEQLKERGEKILRFDYWKRIIDELIEMKTHSVSFSGGECTLHPDFVKLYRYVYDKGLSISIFTNGSAITDEILQMFSEYPPASIQITMYGSTPEKYKLVCGKAEYYDRVVNNIKRLKNAGLNLTLQFTANKDNLEDLEPISDIAFELNVPFRHTMEYLNYRRCDDDIISENIADRKEYLNILKRIIDKQHKAKDDVNVENEATQKFVPQKVPVVEKGITCGAGRSGCAFNYKGEMLPCISLDAIKVKVAGRKIADCWKELVEKCSEVPRLVECTNCIHNTHCRTCIAFHYNDTHEFGKPSPRLCYKVQYPEKAKKIEEFYKANGYILNSMYDD